MSEFPLANDGAVRQIPAVSAHVYSAVWTIAGKDAFWALFGCFTNGLIASGATLASFRYEGSAEQASVEFAVGFPSAAYQAMFCKEADPAVVETVKPFEFADSFELGRDRQARRFRHTIYLVGGENPTLRAVKCWMRALIASKCRLIVVEAGDNSTGCYFDLTIEGTQRQLEIAAGIIACADLEQL